MSDFGDFNTPSEDPTSDFLARERAALGEDADFFTSNDTASPALPMSPSVFDEPSASTASPSLMDFQSSSPMKPNESALVTTSFEAEYPKAEELETSHVRRRNLPHILFMLTLFLIRPSTKPCCQKKSQRLFGKKKKKNKKAVKIDRLILSS